MQSSGDPRPGLFRREDESSDTVFYDEPRLVVHIDAPAIAAVTEYFAEVLPASGAVLDLMSSWRSHLPEDYPISDVVGLGLNPVELNENPQLQQRITHDLNACPELPLESDRFDAVVVTVSVQYMTRPVETFAEVRRLLKVGGLFHVVFSDRMFPTKAVAIWRSLSEAERRAELIAAYFMAAGGWSEPEFIDKSPPQAKHSWGDPVYVVRARKL